uniref:GDSL-like lipase/acylhydrolase n=1 Tax=Pseudomonas phage Touem01 TaxID=3138548 RepID=A0AAU6W320_9VIRU
MGFATVRPFGGVATPATDAILPDLGTCGDSRTAQHFTGSAPNIIREHRGMSYWVGYLTDGAVQVQVAFAGGVGGDTSQMCLVRTPGLVAAKSGAVMTRMGTNDPTSSTYTATWTVDQAIAASIEYISTAIARFLDAGHPVFHISQTPRGGLDGTDKELTGDRLKHLLGILDWELNTLPTLRLGRYRRTVAAVGNAWSLWLDPASTAARPLPLTGLTVDGLHDTSTGAFLCVMSILASVKRLYPVRATLPISVARSLPFSNAAAAPVPLGVLTRNPGMLGTAGSVPASVNPVAGSVLPDEWKSVAASFAGVSSKSEIVSTPVGRGIKITFTGRAASGAYYSLEPAALVSLLDVAAGDKIESIAYMAGAGDLSGCLQASPELRFIRPGGTYYVRDGNKYTAVVMPLLMNGVAGQGISGVTRSPTLVIDKTETEIKQRFTIYLRDGVDLNFSIIVAAHGCSKVY